MSAQLAGYLKALAAQRKPRIKRCTDPRFEWQCGGDGFTGYGNSPSASYLAWRVQRDAELWKREFAKPAPNPWVGNPPGQPWLMN